jgi:hypothetical protein
MRFGAPVTALALHDIAIAIGLGRAITYLSAPKTAFFQANTLSSINSARLEDPSALALVASPGTGGALADADAMRGGGWPRRA